MSKQWAKALVFDYMIKNDLFEYYCGSWSGEPHNVNYKSVQGISGQITYHGETFIVHHSSGHSGRGGMDEGSPPSVQITRIQK